MMPIDFKVVFILFILSIKWSDANDLRGTMVVGENGTENGIIVANRYPYFAMISGSEGSCGGALIAPDIVLSARNVSNTPLFSLLEMPSSCCWLTTPSIFNSAAAYHLM